MSDEHKAPDPDALPEYRSMAFIDFEVRDDGWGFEGLASPYDATADIGEFTEEFKRGAYRKPVAAGENTRLVYDHSPPHFPILASIKGGTMQIRDDVKGLVVRANIAKHYLGEAARELIQRGDIKGMSPGFIVGRGNSEVVMRGDKPHRIIHNLKRLIEISLTPDPAYAATTAELRSLWAMHLAESLGGVQHAFMGAYPQPESRATTEEGTQDTATPEVPDAEEPTDDRGEPVEAPPVVEEQPSGVDADTAYAARTRRLQMLGLTLPRR
jgi:HK97 family phage prohead protease